MLRQVVLQNYIHFEDKHSLSFDKGGAHFLIGENNSGKTSFFEAIRRCMSISKSNGVSGAHDPCILSFITCQFGDKSEDESGSMFVTSSMITIPSFMIKTQTPCDGNMDQCFVKIAQTSTGSQSKVYADLVKKNKEGMLVCCPLTEGLVSVNAHKDDNFPSNIIPSLLKENETPIDEIEQFLKSDNLGKYMETNCEKLLKATVDQSTVISFPFRSISPFQSTETAQKPKTKRQHIARKVSGKADILSWYLRNTEEIQQDERGKEQQYFNIITASSGFRFKIDDGGIISVENKPLQMLHLNSAPLLLKIPEGIYEAKVLAVLLAVGKFKTVCIDDAERGMHPQMIERVRDFILPELRNKTIILITHNQCYITRWNVLNIFLFQRTGNDLNAKFEIKSLMSLFGKQSEGVSTRAATNSTETEEKTLQLMVERTCSSIFFAKNILFVEGKSDELFMSQFMQILFVDEALLLSFIDDGNIQTLDNVRYLFSGICIIPMHGAPNAFKFNSVCQKLQIQHCLLLDYDAICNNIPKGTSGKTDEERFCNALNINMASADRKTLKDNVAILESRGIFIWKRHKEKDDKSGKLENAVMALFSKNKSDLTYLEKSLIDRNKKLLLDRNIRHEYIRDVVRKCLELSIEDKKSDIYRLVKFFIKTASSSKVDVIYSRFK